ncbi:hypothetical protein ACI8AC_06280 [Geodermatophilus sp. SYSU D00758]
MTTLQQHLDDLDAALPIRTLAAALAGSTAVESGRQEQYVSLRPSMEGAVAVYLHKTWISIAVEPDEAAALAARLPGATIHPKTPATTYLHVSADTLAGAPDATLAIAQGAVTWRAQGPRSGAGSKGSASQKAAQYCPDHGYELSPSGVCFSCA